MTELNKSCCDCLLLLENCQCPPLIDKFEILTEKYAILYMENQKLLREFESLKNQSNKRKPMISWGD